MNPQSSLLSKAELKKQIRRFLQDPNRGISIPMFCEICGISPMHMRDVFLRDVYDMTERVQIRVNKGYAEWKAGNIRVMRRPDHTVYVEYRRESKPVYKPSMGLKMTSDGIKLAVGLRNRHDYSVDSLDEQLQRVKT